MGDDPRPHGDLQRDRLARRVARMHYEQGLETGTIAEQIGCSARRVRDLIRLARDTGLISIEVTDVFGSTPTVNRRLGAELERRATLSRALVVEVDDGDAGGGDGDGDGDVNGDQLHYQLGRVAAEYVYDLVDSADDNMAIGAGRGVHFTVRALRELVEQRKPEPGQLEIFSMVGAMWVRTHSMREPSREFVDADQNALELADIFDVPWPKVHLVWLPRLYMAGDQSEKEEVVARVAPHVLGDDWHGQTPKDSSRLSLSLFGLGVVNEGGHFMMRHWGPQTAAVAEIEALRQIVLPVDPTAVVDVCDRFWLRRDADLPADVRAEAQRIVDSLNRRSVAVSFVKLNAARRRCLVAGGAQKLEGLAEVLLHGNDIGIRPNVLITDDRTATALLDRLPET
jgi:DNA-binding transcriptional regulator LsrR (DeoR family)